jgi:uncharacterized protein HemY
MEHRTPESLLEQGRNAKRERRLEDARNAFREALAERHGGEGEPLLATLYEELAYVDRSLGDWETSRQHYGKASEIYRAIHNPLKTAHTIRHAADILREQSKPEEAALLYAEALEIYREHQQTSPLDLANAIRGLALLKEDQKDRNEAVCLWQEAGKLYASTGIAEGVGEAKRRIGLLTGQ